MKSGKSNWIRPRHKQQPKKVIVITGNRNTVVLKVKWYKRDLVFKAIQKNSHTLLNYASQAMALIQQIKLPEEMR